MKKKSRQSKRKINRYIRWLGFKDACYFLIADFLKYKTLRLITIAGEALYARTSTPDIKVAVSCLIHEEYKNIRHADPHVIVDAGANIGTSSMYFAKKYPNAKIFAIEPEQENYDVLVKNISQYRNVIPIKAALWSQKETRVLQDRDTGAWGYTVSTVDEGSSSTGQETQCITVSSLMSDHGIDSIDIFKMDIEGGEKDVLADAGSWIDKVDVLTTELHDRICMGCDRAFYLATKDFTHFEKQGEKVTAYRQ
ncbi:MAG: FkbM family methyltransferase [Pseudomonadales bacterium]